jgi:hypothetical protein
LALLAVMVLATGILLADAEEEPWKPLPPMPEKFDWIQLTSDEWLKGEFIVLYENKLEFDSDELGVLTLDWEDIKQVRSARIMQVRFLNEISAIGKLHIEGEIVRVIGEQDQEFARSKILTIIAGEPRERNFWAGKVTLGANIRQGNSDIVEGNASIRVLRRTIHSRFTFDYLGNYNMTESIETANNHRASAVIDKFISDRFFWRPAFAEYFRDPVQNIAHRGTIGTGFGYQIADTAKTDWEVSGGPAYQRTRNVDVEAGTPESDSTPALTGGTAYDLEITSMIDFSFDYRFQFTDKGAGTYNHHMVAGFETEITSLLDIDISFVWDRIQNPRPDSDGNVPEQDDFRLIFGLTFEF